MRPADRQRLTDLRHALLALHKTLLEWERAAYERLHGRVSGAELLKAMVEDPQFAWLRPISELVVWIDEGLESDAPDTPVDVDAIIARAKALVVPDEAGSPYAQRYHAALQESPDTVFAHRGVTTLLKDIPTRDTLH